MIQMPNTRGPIQPEYHDVMNSLARGIDKILNAGAPEKWGFALIVFGEKLDGRINYICNDDRQDMLVALKEFIARNEGRVSRASLSG